jgi:hypothetical protein
MARKADPPLKLLEAFRVILRALHPKRPELADEIHDIRWFRYPRRYGDPEHGGVPPEEHDAAKMARDVLTKNVRELNIRLVGILDDGKPQEPHEIHQSDCRDGELNIWKNELEVEKYNKVYRQVGCIAADVLRVVRSLAGETSLPVGRMTSAEMSAFVTQYRGSTARPSQRGCEAEAKRTGKAFDRKELRKLYNAAATRGGQAVTPGRPRFRYSPN